MSTQFIRVVEVLCGGSKFSSKDFHIEFRIDFDDDVTPNVSEVTIYNLSDSTISKLKKNAKVTLNAGYKGESGIILSGYVSRVLTKRGGTDHPTTIYVIDSQALDSKKTVNKSYKKGTKASSILKDLAGILGVKVTIKLPKDKAFPNGHSVNGGIIEAMKSIAKECEASFYIHKSDLYIRAMSEGENTSFTLSTETGLIGSPEPFEEETDDNKGRKGYKVKSLLQYRMGTASIITLKSKWANGRYRVRKGSHICQGDTYYTEVEVE